jgi:glutamine---fructose-6-phosphate transaminase (isomerizing)
MTRGVRTEKEIQSQPEVWKSTITKYLDQQGVLAKKLQGKQSRPWLVIGCGSTYYLSLHAASLLKISGIDAWASPSSDVIFFPQAFFPAGYNLLVISRSGTTSESLWAMESYRKQHHDGFIASITCVPETPMIKNSDFAIFSEFAQEESVAQTRSFSSMTIMVQQFIRMLTNKDFSRGKLVSLPDVLQDTLSRSGDLLEKIGKDLSIDRLFYLGSGPYYGIACEAMLKTKEMSCSWSEAYHFMEFRHGPMSVVAPSSLIVGLVSDHAGEAEVQVLREMKEKGGRILVLCNRKGSLNLDFADFVIETNSQLDDGARAVLYLPLIQWIAFHRSIAKGLDPDNPINLTQVVTLTPEMIH